MEYEKLKMIVTIITAFLGSDLGAFLIYQAIKLISNNRTKRKVAQASKLQEQDKLDIAEKVLSKQSHKLKIDADAMVDKATNSRLAKVEKCQVETQRKLAILEKQNYALLSAVGDFKTISAGSREKIQDILKGEPVSVEEIVVEEEPVAEIEKVETKEEVKVSY